MKLADLLDGVRRRVVERARGLRFFAPRPSPAPAFPAWAPFFRARSGIEVGGKSEIFAADGIFPVYEIVAALDNCNFARSTVWQADHGDAFRFSARRAPGRQLFAEGADLSAVVAGRLYDFVLNSHALEHMANPLKALTNWGTLLSPGGVLLTVLPDKRHTFDHRRATTPLDHMVDDFEGDVDEGDLGHFDEIMRDHDVSLDPGVTSHEEFRARSLRNRENRCLHHHVFEMDNAVALVRRGGYHVLAQRAHGMHLFVLAKKPS